MNTEAMQRNKSSFAWRYIAVLRRLTFPRRALRRLAVLALLPLLAVQAYAATLLGEYRLEELSWNGSAAEVRDTSGNNRHGQTIGSPLPSPVFAAPARPGKPGTCTYGSFPGPTGNGGALSIGGLPVNLAAGAKTSVSFWMYWDGTNSVMPIGWFRHDLWLTGGHFGFNTGNSDVYGISSAGLANRWVHVVAEFTNGNVAANALYIDGVAQVLTQRQSTPANGNAVVNATLRVGGWQSDTGYRFSGRIDEVKVYDGALTLAEVTTLFNETHACAPRLTLEWRMDECALGAVPGEVLDASGNGNNGTPLGVANTGAGRICKGGVFNGISPTRVKAATNFADAITNDFSIAFWVNPTGTHQIDAQSTSGAAGTGGQRYALYPVQGTEAWGANHAGAGISVGTNGVSVYEHAASYMPAPLVWTGALSGWTHVAVTYQARQPRLYINGALVATGLTSPFANVHPGLRSASGVYVNNDGGVGGGYWGWFNGGIDELRVYDGALDAAQVASIASATPRPCASCATLAHYRLEEAAWAGVAGEVQDTSGNARHGQALGAPLPVPAIASPARAGSPGTCGYGTLAGGALNLPVAANTAAGAKTTVSFWMYWDGTNSVMPIGWFRHDLWLTGGHFGFNTANSDVFGISSAGLANRWTHVSAVFTNGSVIANKLYIDGVSQVLTQRQSTPNPATAVVNANLRIGGWQSDNGYRFRSRIDEVNVFDGEMTPSQVLAQFNATHPCGGAVVPANFNCVAAGEPVAAGHLFTKLAGTAFDFDVVALKSDGSRETGYAAGGNKNVSVELVEGSGATACASRAALTPAVSQTLTFTAGDAGRKAAANMTVGNAHRELRCRVTDANQIPAVVGCSTDSFAVRPTAFTVSSSNANADATGTSAGAIPIIKAGAAFSLTATALAGYDGTPALDASKAQAHAGAVQTGVLTGGFPAANPATGAATGNAFAYDEVGYFRLDTNGVTDTIFTSVDAGSGDCTADYSNSLVGGRYGCNFGNSAPTSYFGRFVPDRLDAEIPALACGTFTYSGQPFPARITARNVAGATTRNYSGTFAKNVTFSDVNGNPGSFLPLPLPAGDFISGVADLTATPSVRFTFTSALTAPATIRLRATDAEGVSSATGSEGTTPIRSGRLNIQNAHGSELRALPVSVTAQYFTGTGFATNTEDNCTTVAPGNIMMGNWQRNLAACETGLSGGGTLSGGTTQLRLGQPGAGNDGSVDLTVRLGASPGATCLDALPVGPPYSAAAVTSTGATWLQFPLGSDPAARATFGVYRDRLIYRREVTR